MALNELTSACQCYFMSTINLLFSPFHSYYFLFMTIYAPMKCTYLRLTIEMKVSLTLISILCPKKSQMETDENKINKAEE